MVLRSRMKSVEHRIAPSERPPLVYWADRIEIVEGDGLLNLCGRKRIPPSAAERSLLKGYLDAIANENPKAGIVNTAPHIVFANCLPEYLLDLESPARTAEEASLDFHAPPLSS
jgi:hypothetical protein